MNISPSAKSESAATAGSSMLYIDDNPANNTLMKFIMALRPAITLLGSDAGLPGVALARERLPDLVLLDYHLPDMNGDQVLKLLLGDPRTAKIPVVMLSGDATSDQVDRLLRLGASGYITKPFNVHSLLASVDTFIGASRG